jgi:hypothetical protein
MATRHPAAAIQWRPVESSNVAAVGWDRATGMYVEYRSGAVYRYAGVSRQRAVACAYAATLTRLASVGAYVNRRVKPVFPSTRIGGAM